MDRWFPPCLQMPDCTCELFWMCSRCFSIFDTHELQWDWGIRMSQMTWSLRINSTRKVTLNKYFYTGWWCLCSIYWYLSFFRRSLTRRPQSFGPLTVGVSLSAQREKGEKVLQGEYVWLCTWDCSSMNHKRFIPNACPALEFKLQICSANWNPSAARDSSSVHFLLGFISACAFSLSLDLLLLGWFRVATRDELLSLEWKVAH